MFPRYLSQFDLTGYRKVLLIRDPRDMVVSHYFSQKLSHAIPQGELGERLLAIRSELESKSIDQYAIESAPAIKRRFDEYQESIFDDNMKLFRYEDVIFEKRRWLREVLDYVGIESTPDLIQSVADSKDFVPRVEDPSRHIRQVTPGDHRNKLLPATIEILNDVFADHLNRFQYSTKCSETTTAA